MVRRLLLTALLATLAVALPAAAEGDPAAPESPPGSDAPACQPSDLFCGLALNLYGVPTVGEEFQGHSDTRDDSACRAWSMNWPDGNRPVTDTVIVDPDGCLRSFVRRTLGWPPLEENVQVHLAPASNVLPWP